MNSLSIRFLDNKIPYLKLNVTEEYVVSSGDNVTVFVQASDPEGKAVNVSYSVDGSIFYKLSSNLVIIGPVYDRKELRIKARDYCGLETTATAVIGKLILEQCKNNGNNGRYVPSYFKLWKYYIQKQWFVVLKVLDTKMDD